MSLAGLIAVQRAEHGVPYAVSCRALGVSQAWFYKWRNGDRSPRHMRRAELATVIGTLFGKHHGSYGSPRITADLRELGWRVGPEGAGRVGPGLQPTGPAGRPVVWRSDRDPHR